MEQMLMETLSYLRDDARSEPALRVDLPSLLETICIQLADLGKSIAYEGPKMLVYRCQAGSMTRAISNLVDNAVKHGTNVTVILRTLIDGSIQIDVDDDGPGIPYPLRKRVFEPFFKIDNARTSKRTEGFGLGLSIARNVVEAHNGTIELLECVPHGLRVRICLPAEQ
jgi:signal transduction histidine kinase